MNRAIRLLFAFIILSVLQPVFAQEADSLSSSTKYKATLHIGGMEDFTQARPVPFEFHFYPVGEKTIREVEPIINVGRFLGNFFVFEITEKGFSPNNQDVFVAKGRLVMADLPRKNQIFSVKFEGNPIEVEIRSKEPKELKMEGKEIIFVSLPFLYRMTWMEKLIYAILAVCAFSSLMYGLRKLILSMKKKKERKKLRQRILESFSNAQTRDDYERIYRQRQEWIDFLGGKNPETVTFLKNIEDVQYKREWTEEEAQAIKEKSQEVLRTIETQ